MPQLDYGLYQAKGYEGQIITTFPSGIRNGQNVSGARIPFGRVLVRGTGDTDCRLPSATGQRVMGFSTKTDIYEMDEAGLPSYPLNRPLNRMLKGDMLVKVETAVTPDSPVFFRHTAGIGVNDAIGRLRVDADAGKADALPGVKFLDVAAAGSMVRITVDILGYNLIQKPL
ncbi:MAG: structural cement protein Gp24 [Waterburya sp.]